MTTRLIAGATAALLLGACQAGPAPSSGKGAPATQPSPSPAHAPPPAPRPRLALLPYVERVTAGADPKAALPLVIAIHGRGDRPERFVSLFDGLTCKARVVAPHPETPFGDGYTWFDGGIDLKSAAAMAGRAVDLVALAREIRKTKPTLGDTVVVGFSQGGALAFHLGTAYPATVVAAVFPVGGWLPEALVPTSRPTPSARIVAFHGTADDVVPFKYVGPTVATLKAKGFDATLHEYPGVSHQIPEPERGDLLAAVAAECEKQATAGPGR